jgi:hypothetical protein
VTGCVLLLGVNVDRHAVEVQDHPLGRRTRPPCPLPRERPRRPDPLELTLADRQQHPPRRGNRCHLAEERALSAERGQV